MPAPRKPTSQLALSGALKRNPGRHKDRAAEAKPTAELGPKIPGLTELEAACWDRIIALCPPGVLKNSDEAIVELTARLWAAVKSGKAKAATIAQLRVCLQQLGMTPAARSLVAVPHEGEKSEFLDV